MAEINAKLFHKRAIKYLSAWKDATASSKLDDFDFDCMVVAVGDAGDEDSSYFKGTVVHNWLFGYEFPDTLVLVTPTKFTVLTSSKKAKYFEPLQTKAVENRVTLEILARPKDEKENADLLQTFINKIEGTKVGYFPKDRYTGKFLNEWNKVLAASERAIDKVDGTKSWSVVMAVKDEEEVKHLSTAAKLSSLVMKNYLYGTILQAIDKNKTVTHAALSESTEGLLEEENSKRLAALKIPNNIAMGDAEWCYPPIIQSGGKYDLKPSAQSDESPLNAGTVICAVGVRYNAYCSTIGRTLLFINDKKRAKHYTTLVELQKHLLSNVIKDGVKCSDVQSEAQKFLEKANPELLHHLTLNLGSVIGIDFRDPNFTINAKTQRPLRNGMVLNLSVGFEKLESDLSDKQNKIYALFLADTVLITTEGCQLLTDMNKELKDINFNLRDDPAKENGRASITSPKQQKNSKVVSSKLRNDDRGDDQTDDVKKRDHQRVLSVKVQQAGLERFAEGDTGDKKAERATFRKYETYRNNAAMPPDVKNLQIVVDRRTQAIILPIFNQAVPFHITTLKNVTKSDEGEYSYLRFNFITPGAGVRKESNKEVFEDPNATFIRSLSYRSAEIGRFNEIHREVTELKKVSIKREAERAQLADLVEQDKLVEVKGKRPSRLAEVYARPQLEGKRAWGDLEIHTNGLRYVSHGHVLFSNIQHLFFQPCQGELIVILHINLKHPIMIGKRKTKDVQFYRDVVDASFDETGNRKRRFNYGDEDELKAEQEERKRREQLDKEFKAFAEKISEASDRSVDVEVPYRELGFQGVPFKQNVLMQPTQNCLVHLTEPPFLVVTMSDIEVAHLERVSFGLKNFDLVFVFKDFTKPVVHINTIAMSSLDTVKDWLNESDVSFSEGPVNLNWGPIMKTINEDPADFFRQGGWAFLRTDGEDSDGGESDEESEFAISGSDASSESDSESEFDSNASGSDSGSASASGSDEEEEESEEEDRGKKSKSKNKRSSEDDTSPRATKKQKR
ncbi:hypothetical protein SeMB42_g00678 [Synchytrium endobioticum]|uniref:FACT complex subunit n=1 Tax=Synchytrium endobioticum TaxID=286115 RepID=A0A507DQS0_9FUNG|nr:hypothetical protein SeLEV6574_g00834 [Synchytrium endobioticum]TPX53575.1 hypothetical protein SeMB42_g00678 [Synchytrium endobioticum]